MADKPSVLIPPESSWVRISPEAAATGAVEQGTQDIGNAIRRFAVPALGAAAGFAVGGPPGAFVGAAGSDVADYYIRLGLSKWLNKPTPPPPTGRELWTDAVGALTAYGTPALATRTATGAFTKAPQYGQLPKFERGGVLPWRTPSGMVITPQMQKGREAAAMAESVGPESQTVQDLLGSAASIDPAQLPAQQTARYAAQMKLTKAEARKPFAVYDRVWKSKANAVEPGKVQVGVRVDKEGNEIPVLNKFPIRGPVNYIPIAQDLEELQVQFARSLGPEHRLTSMVRRVTEGDWIRPIEELRHSISAMVRIARDPEVGANSTLQSSAARVAGLLQKRFNTAVEELASKAHTSKPATVKSMRAGKQSWRENYAQVYDTPEAEAAAKAGKTDMPQTFLGANDAQARRLLLAKPQFGPEAVSDWGRSQWKRAIDGATDKGKFDPAAFDKTLWHPGMTTMKYIFPDGNAVSTVIGPQAVRHTSRKIFDAILTDGNYTVWNSLSQNTRELVAGGDPARLAVLDDFFTTAQNVLENTPMTRGRAQALARDVLKFAGGMAAHATTPGTGGTTQRQIIRMVQALTNANSNTLVAMVARMKMWLPGNRALVFAGTKAITPKSMPIPGVAQDQDLKISGQAPLVWEK